MCHLRKLLKSDEQETTSAMNVCYLYQARCVCACEMWKSIREKDPSEPESRKIMFLKKNCSRVSHVPLKSVFSRPNVSLEPVSVHLISVNISSELVYSQSSISPTAIQSLMLCKSNIMSLKHVIARLVSGYCHISLELFLFQCKYFSLVSETGK